MKLAALIEPPNDLVEKIYHWAKGNVAAIIYEFSEDQDKKNEAKKHINKTPFVKVFKIEEKPFKVKISIDLKNELSQYANGIWDVSNKQLIIIITPNRKENFQGLLKTLYGTIRHELIHIMQDYEVNFGLPGNIQSKIDISDISKSLKVPKEELKKYVEYANIPEEFYANLSDEIYRLKEGLVILPKKYWFKLFKIFVGASKPKKIKINNKEYTIKNSNYFLSLSINSQKWRKAVKLFYSNLQDSGFSF